MSMICRLVRNLKVVRKEDGGYFKSTNFDVVKIISFWKEIWNPKRMLIAPVISGRKPALNVVQDDCSEWSVLEKLTYSLTYLLTNLVSQTICGKAVFFQTCITFDQNVISALKYIHQYNKISRIDICYQFLTLQLCSLAVIASFGGGFSA